MTQTSAPLKAADQALQPASSYYKHHVFFCLNERSNGQDACGHHGAQQAFDHCKAQVKAAGLAGPTRRGGHFGLAACRA